MHSTLSRCIQTRARDAHRGLSLDVSRVTRSPYFQTIVTRKVGSTSRNIKLIPVTMITVFVEYINQYRASSTEFDAQINFTVKDSADTYSINDSVRIPLSATDTADTIKTASEAAIAAYAVTNGFSISGGIVWLITPGTVLPMSFATPTRSLNSAFQVSSTRAAMVSYTVDIASTLSLTSGQTGTVTLQYADDSGFTTNVKTVQSSANGNTGSLTIGLGLTQTATASLTGIIPAGKYVRLVTANTTGTPTFTMRTAQEVLLGSN